MKKRSRCFLCVGVILILGCACGTQQRSRTADRSGPVPLKSGSLRLGVGPKGTVDSIAGNLSEWISPSGAAEALSVQIGSEVLPCLQVDQVSHDSTHASFNITLDSKHGKVGILYEVGLRQLDDRFVLSQFISIQSSEPIRENVQVTIPFALKLVQASQRQFLPLKTGVGMSVPLTHAIREWRYYVAGTVPDVTENLLAIPLYDRFSLNSPWRLTFVSDPYLSTEFVAGDSTDADTFRLTYEGSRVPFLGPEERTFYTIIYRGDAGTAIDNFYRTALAAIPPGPDWLHDIAMVDYDYLSDGGEGWFRDIDWLCERVPRNERRHVCLALHGWYDLLGRYGFDAKTGRMCPRWIAFPNAPNVLAKFPNSRSVAMTPDEVRRRLHYARDRGFRVVLYFADGLAICEGATEEFSTEKILYSGGWQGPDTIGPTHIQNPLHPEVWDWYIAYMKALLQEFGDHTDGFVWDETFHVDPGNLGPSHCAGYASRSMMQLCRELTSLVHVHRRDCVFLASDCIGAFQFELKAPYALVTDGTYQDSHCQPAAWPYGIFPNYRNVLWSCNWWPVKTFDRTRYGVERFQAPVVITNGWGDDLGVSEMPEETAQQVMDLFHQRMKVKTQLRWLDAP